MNSFAYLEHQNYQNLHLEKKKENLIFKEKKKARKMNVKWEKMILIR